MAESAYFKRKAYDRLLDWKENYADRYAALIEGARRVGKSTLAEHFAKNEYESYIMIDFSTASADELSCFDDIGDLDLFFLRLQAIRGVTLRAGSSVVIFDEVQLFPRARQAVKRLVSDGRYHYIETGSLISIKKNVKDILIPSEEMRIPIFPMDFEEFCLATGKPAEALGAIYERGKPVGQQTNRKLMRDMRIYMAVGGMPQAVRSYAGGDNFSAIDQVKRGIIRLYEDDFRKVDPSGRMSAMYHSIPAQLSKNAKRYRLSQATGKRKSQKDEELLYDLVESKTVLISYNATDPSVSLPLTRDLDSYKLYLSDTGLFVTLMFIDRPSAENELYAKLLSDKLPANLGYLYENLMAQIIAASGRELFYHTWEREGSTHCYEVDFLLAKGAKVSAIEVKSSGTGKHESLLEFKKKYSSRAGECYLVSQKDLCADGEIRNIPAYLAPMLAKSLE